jgi:hypothetical protein
MSSLHLAADGSQRTIGLLAVLSLILSVGAFTWTVVQWSLDKRHARAIATVNFWIGTQDLRMTLREPKRLPYEHDGSLAALARTLTLAYESAATSGRPVGLTSALRSKDDDLRRYLSIFETLGAAVNHGSFDGALIGRIDGPRIVALRHCCERYIDARRTYAGNPAMYVEFVQFADWLDVEQPWGPS